jgi:predicted  nucleic acid-binding Zn-ribbon protein
LRDNIKALGEQHALELRELEVHDGSQTKTISDQKTEINSLNQLLADSLKERQGMEEQILTAQLALHKRSARLKGGLADDERNFL